MSEVLKEAAGYLNCLLLTGSPRPCPVSLLIFYFFFLAIYCHLAYLSVLYVPPPAAACTSAPESRNAVLCTGCAVPETEPTQTVTRSTQQNILCQVTVTSVCATDHYMHRSAHREQSKKSRTGSKDVTYLWAVELRCNCKF